MFHQHLIPRIRTLVIANGASQSELLDVRQWVRATYFVPSAFTNTGAINLGRWGVSNIFPEPSGTDIIALLPSTAIATAQTQRHTVSTWYPLLPDVFKFKAARFDGVTTEAAERTLVVVYFEDPSILWQTFHYGIANGQTVSDTIDLDAGGHGHAVGGSFLIPAAFTGTAITYQVSGDGSNFTVLNDTADADISQGAAVDRWVPLPDGVFAHRYLKLVSGSAEGAARVIRVDLKYVA